VQSPAEQRMGMADDGGVLGVRCTGVQQGFKSAGRAIQK
jgi:hypothetical protein